MCDTNYKCQLFTNVNLFCEKIYILPLFPGTNYKKFVNLTTEHTSLLRRDLNEVWYISTFQSHLKRKARVASRGYFINETQK
jgi:hypothetical protein